LPNKKKQAAMTTWTKDGDVSGVLDRIRRPDAMAPARFQRVYDEMFAHNMLTTRQRAITGEGLSQLRNAKYGRLVTQFLWAIVERHLAPRTKKRRFFLCPHATFLKRGDFAVLHRSAYSNAMREFVAHFLEQRFSRDQPGICVIPIALFGNKDGHAFSLAVENAGGFVTARFINSNRTHYARRTYADIASQFVPAYAGATVVNDDEHTLQLMGTCAVYSVVATMLYLDATPVVDGRRVPEREMARRKVAISRIANAVGVAEGMCGDRSLEDVIVRGGRCDALAHAADAIWHEYTNLRGLVRLSCPMPNVAAQLHLLPRPAGAPGAEREMLDVIRELHQWHHADDGVACADAASVRELLRQYYWRDYYLRSGEAWRTAHESWEAGGSDLDLECEWIYTVMTGLH
jgi:hypothetical protein